MADSPEGHAVMLTDVDRLEKWADRDLLKANMEKCRASRLGRGDPRHQNMELNMRQ